MPATTAISPGNNAATKLPQPGGKSKLASETVDLAAKLLERSRELETPAETKEGEELNALIQSAEAKELTFHLTDQVFRPASAVRSAAIFRSLIKRYGTPSYLSWIDRTLMRAGALASWIAPWIVMPAVTSRLRAETNKVILPAGGDSLTKHRERRQQQGAGMNLNLLGEAVLGEGEARRWLKRDLDALESGTTNYVSIKLSCISSQITLADSDATCRVLAERVRALYRAAMSQSPAGFVNLDMEEYRDLHLTLDVFRSVLSEPEFFKLRAGIALQTYLPDALPILRDLTKWARQRVAAGGAPIKVRLVKGANLAMEQVDAAMHAWPQAPYSSKLEVDANFLRVLDSACEPENARVVNIGVASHNLFSIAYALRLRERNGVEDHVDIEMLEGMASPQARAVLEQSRSMVFYCPAVQKQHFNAAIAYLIRRLDENTTEGNFLHDLFDIKPGNASWKTQRDAFLAACELKPMLATGPNRTQDRRSETPRPQQESFENTPDTDFSLPANREWLRDVLTATPATAGTSPTPTPADIDHALASAADSRWGTLPQPERADLLRHAAVEIARNRGSLIAALNRSEHKTPADADAEVSAAIDHANYYAHSFTGEAWNDGLSHSPLGPVLATTPGDTLAALAAGNPVLFTPSPETAASARLLAGCLWLAGIPRDALQLLHLADNELTRSLVTDSRLAAAVLAGSNTTAERFLCWRPDLRIHATTTGNNSLVITAAADPDNAIKDLVQSAFRHSGRKGSAASIGLVEKSLLENSGFRERLRDAVASLKVGAADDPAAIITPLDHEPSSDLLRGLTQLDPGESWLLEPTRPDPANPTLWTPGIRLGVKPGSWIHRTELRGPLLALVPCHHLDEAIALQNNQPGALSGGIHSLDPAEITRWTEQVEVGMAFINRTITGAIVGRQPFGGWKRSSLGPGAKSGGPNYVQQFAVPGSDHLPSRSRPPGPALATLLRKCLDLSPAADHGTLQAAAGNAAYWMETEFSVGHDPSQLAPETNTFRYRPVPQGTLRISDALSLCDTLVCTLMATAAGSQLTWSAAKALDDPHSAAAAALGIPVIEESDSELQSRLAATPLATLRSPGQACCGIHSRNCAAPVTAHARLELLPFLLEQTVSETRHRHGRLLD